MSNKTEGTLFLIQKVGDMIFDLEWIRFMADYIVENALR